jgi:hypothetical protein
VSENETPRSVKAPCASVDVLDAEVEDRVRAELLGLRPPEVQMHAVAVEERHRLTRHLEQERHAEHISVERHRPVDVRHAHVDLSDSSQPFERHDLTSGPRIRCRRSARVRLEAYPRPVTTFRERLVSTDAVVRTHLEPDEHVLAIGRCADVTERGGPEQGGTTATYVMVTDRCLRWVPWADLRYEASLGLDEVTWASEHQVAHHFSITLVHLPLVRLHVVPAHRFLRYRWGNAFSMEPLTRTELAFSRRDTQAASALRGQLAARGTTV